MTLGLKLCLNGFEKNFIKILWIFSCNKCILLRLWVKVFLSQEWVQAKITVDLELISQILGYVNLHFWPCQSQ